MVTATNHPELLDRAVWRRFQIRLELPRPQEAQIVAWLKEFEQRLGEPLRCSPDALAPHLKGLSFAELEEFTTSVLRRRVLEGPEADLNCIVHRMIKQKEMQAHSQVSEES